MDHKMANKTLKAPRREFLREYVLACVRENVLSWGDLASGAAVDKLLRAISSDIREVATDILSNGAKNGLRVLGDFLSSRSRKGEGR